MSFPIGSQISQVERQVRPVVFDSSFRDAMRGGGRWKRFVRIEETSEGVMISADSLFVLLWNRLWGRGHLYRHSTDRLHNVVQQLHLKGHDQISNPFKLFCSRVVTSKIKAGAIGRDAVPQAVQLLMGLRLLQNLAAVTELPFNEVCERIAGKIRQGVQPEWTVAFELLKSEEKKLAIALKGSSSLFHAMIENCQSEQEFEALVNYLCMLRQYKISRETLSNPYTLMQIKEIVAESKNELPKWQQELFSSETFQQLARKCREQLHSIPQILGSKITGIFALDVVTRVWATLFEEVDRVMKVVLGVVNRDADSVLTVTIAFVACCQLEQQELEKLALGIQAADNPYLDSDDLDGAIPRSAVNIEMALEQLKNIHVLL